jgi:hypothetical protein
MRQAVTEPSEKRLGRSQALELCKLPLAHQLEAFTRLIEERAKDPNSYTVRSLSRSFVAASDND